MHIQTDFLISLFSIFLIVLLFLGCVEIQGLCAVLTQFPSSTASPPLFKRDKADIEANGKSWSFLGCFSIASCYNACCKVMQLHHQDFELQKAAARQLSHCSWGPAAMPNHKKNTKMRGIHATRQSLHGMSAKYPQSTRDAWNFTDLLCRQHFWARNCTSISCHLIKAYVSFGLHVYAMRHHKSKFLWLSKGCD